MGWYKVVSRIPVCVNHQNGQAVSYPRGTIFEADDALRDIRRLRRQVPKPIIPVGKTSKAIPAPGPSLPLPSNRPLPRPKLPGGIHELVRSR